ncbi:MAG: site-specific integrase [Candidatus Bathyarchaeia archaeon]
MGIAKKALSGRLVDRERIEGCLVMVEASALSPNERPEAGNGPCCPECGSAGPFRDGLRYLADGSAVQRFLCRFCGFRFSWPRVERRRGSVNFKRNADVTIGGCSSRVQALLERRMEGLMDGQMENGQRAAGATATDRADIKSAIVNFAWKLKREGYSEATIKEYCYILETLNRRGANLLDPESVKDCLARQGTWSNARKSIVVKAYTAFLKNQGLTWSAPNYKVPQKLPFIPLEKELDDLIAGCNRQMSAFLQLLKETGARCGEAFDLKWTDVDLTNNTVRITPEKGSNPRIFKISTKLASMLSNLPKKSIRVFSYKNKFYLRKSFEKQRKKVSFKLGNPRLLRISFHTFRHWKATMEYYKTKDILYVMQLLGHKNIKNTLIYTQLVKNISEDEYICKAAKTIEEATQLIEAGFEFVCDMEGCKLFRKRK